MARVCFAANLDQVLTKSDQRDRAVSNFDVQVTDVEEDYGAECNPLRESGLIFPEIRDTISTQLQTAQKALSDHHNQTLRIVEDACAAFARQKQAELVQLGSENNRLRSGFCQNAGTGEPPASMSDTSTAPKNKMAWESNQSQTGAKQVSQGRQPTKTGKDKKPSCESRAMEM
jgi:hypothetical protein